MFVFWWVWRLPDVQKIYAKEAQQLQGQDALLVDTRTEKD